MDVQQQQALLLDNSTGATTGTNSLLIPLSGIFSVFLQVILTSVSTVLIGCWRSKVFDDESECNNHIEEEDEEVGRGGRVSQDSETSPLWWLIPVGSSCALLIMFFFFSYVQHILLAAMIVASVYSLFFLMNGLRFDVFGILKTRGQKTHHRHHRRHPLLYWYSSKIAAMLSVMSILITVSWLVTGHWILHNIIASSICIAFLSHVRIPNIKTCIMLLSLLFFYDIFWVFGSSYIFGDNVMITAAMQRADNVNLLVSHPSTIELPTKFIFPYGDDMTRMMMLGCGDVAMPGLLIVCVYMTMTPRHQLVSSALCGYVVGLVAVLVSSAIVFQAAQPALLYMVPTMFLSIYLESQLIRIKKGNE